MLNLDPIRERLEKKSSNEEHVWVAIKLHDGFHNANLMSKVKIIEGESGQ